MPEGMRRGRQRGVYRWDGVRGLGIEMVYVAPGDFMRGDDEALHAQPPHHVRVTEAFYLMRYPVQVGEFRRYAQAPETRVSSERWQAPGFAQTDTHPVTCINWHDAFTCAGWMGLRLPTETEWELAARGADGRAYPWGDNRPSDRFLWWSETTSRDGTCPVGQHPLGAAPCGAQDMAGNVWEWTADWYTNYPMSRKFLVDPTGPVYGSSRVLRGGSWNIGLVGDVHAASRYPVPPDIGLGGRGARFARGASE